MKVWGFGHCGISDGTLITQLAGHLFLPGLCPESLPEISVHKGQERVYAHGCVLAGVRTE